MPSDLRTVLELKARESGRSLHQELLIRLEDSLREDRPKPESPAKLQSTIEAGLLLLEAIAQKVGVADNVVEGAKAMEAMPVPMRDRLDAIRESLKGRRIPLNPEQAKY
jgi:hypothetical protein